MKIRLILIQTSHSIILFNLLSNLIVNCIFNFFKNKNPLPQIHNSDGATHNHDGECPLGWACIKLIGLDNVFVPHAVTIKAKLWNPVCAIDSGNIYLQKTRLTKHILAKKKFILSMALWGFRTKLYVVLYFWTGMRADTYTIVGCVIAVSLVHGGPLPTFMSSTLYSAISRGVNNTSPTLDDIEDQDIRGKLQDVSDFSYLNRQWIIVLNYWIKDFSIFSCNLNLYLICIWLVRARRILIVRVNVFS